MAGKYNHYNPTNEQLMNYYSQPRRDSERKYTMASLAWHIVGRYGQHDAQYVIIKKRAAAILDYFS